MFNQNKIKRNLLIALCLFICLFAFYSLNQWKYTKEIEEAIEETNQIMLTHFTKNYDIEKKDVEIVENQAFKIKHLSNNIFLLFSREAVYLNKYGNALEVYVEGAKDYIKHNNSDYILKNKIDDEILDFYVSYKDFLKYKTVTKNKKEKTTKDIENYEDEKLYRQN